MLAVWRHFCPCFLVPSRASRQVSTRVSRMLPTVVPASGADFQIVCRHLVTGNRQLFSQTSTSRLSAGLASFSMTNSTHVFSSEKPSGSFGEFAVIYRFPKIVVLRLFVRLSMMYSTIVVASFPYFAMLYSNEDISYGMFGLQVNFLVTALILTVLVRKFLCQTVGLMGMNASRTTVRLSHLSMLGNRKDVFVKVRDMVPVTDSGGNARSEEAAAVLLKTYNSKKSMVLVLKFAQILDREKLEMVTGKLD